MTKPTKWPVPPAKTQISLDIRPISSESSLSAWRKAGSLDTHKTHSEDSDQPERMSRLIWVFDGCTCRCVSFVMRRLKCKYYWKHTMREPQWSLYLCTKLRHNNHGMHKCNKCNAHKGNAQQKHLSHDTTKPTKWPCVQRRLRSAWAFAQSDQSSLCAHG